MPSLVKTFLRCHSTVRGLRNSRAPISGLESPSPASRAIWLSWAVRSSIGVHGPLAGGLAGGQEFAAGTLGEAFDAHHGEHVVRGA